MEKQRKLNLSKEIINEKGRFLANNSTYFYKNIEDQYIMSVLKSLLSNLNPLCVCPEYKELIENMKEHRDKNISQLIYRNSLTVLFHIISVINDKYNLSVQGKKDQIELLRSYVKFILDNYDGHINNIIDLDTEKANKIIAEDKVYRKQKGV